MKYPAIFAILLLSTHALSASEDLASMQKRYDSYQQLPDGKGNEVIHSYKANEETMLEFAKFIEKRKIKVVLSESVKTRTVSMTLRDFSLKRVIDYVTANVSADWIYCKDQLVIFDDMNELKGSYRKYAMEREALRRNMEPYLRKKRERERASAEVEKYKINEASIIIPHLKIENLPIKKVADELASQAAKNGEVHKKFRIIGYPSNDSPLISADYTNKSLSKILDGICAEYKLQWTYREGVIILRKK